MRKIGLEEDCTAGQERGGLGGSWWSVIAFTALAWETCGVSGGSGFRSARFQIATFLACPVCSRP